MEAKTEPPVVADTAAAPKATTMLTLLVVLVHGTQASFNLLAGTKGPSLNVSMADLLLGAAFLVWIAGRFRRCERLKAKLALPMLGVVWLGLSLLPGLKGGAREDFAASRYGFINVLQFFEYFVVAYLLFVDCFRADGARRWALRLLGLAVTFSALLALIQYLSDAPVAKVRGAWFEDRNTFGVFLALTLPLLVGVATFNPSWLRREFAALLSVVGLCVCLAGGPYLAICLGLLTVSMLKRPGKFTGTAVVLALLSVLVLPHLPRRNSAVLLDSVALYRADDPYAVFGEDAPRISSRLKEKQEQLAGKIGESRPVGFTDIPTEQDYSWKWSQRYKEWQAALNMMARSPLFGVGAGAYQKNVNNYYGPVPKYPVNLLEPNTLSMYMVWGASAGVPFLMILFGMFLRSGVSAARAFGTTDSRDVKGVAAGVIGSLVAAATVGVFSDPLVRGLGITLALVLALGRALELSMPAKSERAP